jgi:Rod binding domain-containing protein
VSAPTLPPLGSAAGVSALRRNGAAAAAGLEPKRAGLRDASKQFESVFLSLLVKEMTQGIEGLFGEGAGSEIYRGLFESTMGQSLSGKGFGLAATIENALAGREPSAAPLSHALAPRAPSPGPARAPSAHAAPGGFAR